MLNTVEKLILRETMVDSENMLSLMLNLTVTSLASYGLSVDSIIVLLVLELSGFAAYKQVYVKGKVKQHRIKT